VLPGVRLLAAPFTSGAYRSKPIVPDNFKEPTEYPANGSLTFHSLSQRSFVH
jgi:hypothetical protein